MSSPGYFDAYENLAFSRDDDGVYRSPQKQTLSQPTSTVDEYQR
jgi:hypothetical protein